VTTIPEALAAAVLHHQAGRLDRAEQIYRLVVEASPNHADALHLLGVIASQRGKHEEASDYILRAIKSNPNEAMFHGNLGIAYRSLGRFDDAVAAYRRALAIRPDLADTHYNLGIALKAQGRLDEAVAAYRQALQIDPGSAKIRNNLGVALADLGKPDEAVASYRQAIQIQPGFADAHNNLGVVFRDQGNPDQAVACYRQALQIDPDHAGAYSNLANVHKDRGDVAEEEACYREILRLQPDQHLWELRIATRCPVVFQSSQEIDHYRGKLLDDLKRFSGRELQLDLATLANSGCQPPFALPYQGRDDRPIKEAYAAIFRDCFTAESPAVSTGRPRVGFVVTHKHETGFLALMGGILERLDCDLIEPMVICSRVGSTKIQAGLKNQAVQILPLPERLDRIVNAVRAARFDVLYYWEVGSDAVNYLLPFFRLAPVQCTGWGIPVTSGIPQMDYYLSNELVETDDADRHYTERLIRAGTLLSFQHRISPPEQPKKREDFGLPAGRNVYFCPHQILKFHPDFDSVLAGILHQDGSGVLVIPEDDYGHVAKKLRDRFAATIADVLDRVVFLPRQPYPDYLSLLAAADVLLDPLHYGGGATTYDGLSFNRPIVTLPGRFARGRFTSGCYRKMGVPDCVASDELDYVRIAVRLGTDRDYREEICSKIASAGDVLFEDLEAVSQLEEFFGQAVEASREKGD